MKEIKAEKIMIVLYTDKRGRQIVGGANVESGRDWKEIFSDAVTATAENDGQVIDLNN